MKNISLEVTYFVYILECADTTLYIGLTNDIDKRLSAHNSSPRGAKYTRGRRPVVLRYTEVAKGIGAARKREAELKRLTRTEKLALFSG